LRDHEQEIEAVGASVVAIGLGDARYAAAFRDETGIPFPLLVDGDRRAYRAAGLANGSLLTAFHSDNRQARARAKAAGHRQHKTGKNPLQLGGSFVFAPGDRDLYLHASEYFGDNTPVADLLAVLTNNNRGQDTFKR
jgi:hypothetical protein